MPTATVGQRCEARHERGAVSPGEMKATAPLSDEDLVALSFVYHLRRAPLYSMLRGEQPIATAGERPGGRDGTASLSQRSPDRPVEPARPAPADRLEALLAALGVDDAAAEADEARGTAQRAVAKARDRGVEAVTWLSARYPPLLAGIFDPPLVLWIRGSIETLSERAVAIVGSRGASVYGEEAAARIASGLASLGFVIVSGLARGIDAAAHRGALAARGRTVAVLGCGPDVVYPPEHAALTEEVVRSGAIVSELAPGTRPRAMHFPRRNRIISALSLGVVVVEARQRSGALITADCALEQGREVMAVPGNVLSERHRGSHTLLKSGAALVETAEDVVQALGLAGSRGEVDRPQGVEDPLLASMDAGEPYALDQLVGRVACDAAALLSRLLELELQGLVRRVAGGRFVRSGGTC